MPDILSVQLSETIKSVSILNNKNLDTKLEDSTVFCRFENQIINKLFK